MKGSWDELITSNFNCVFCVYLERTYIFTGTNAFLMGDQPCQEDCAIFGMLAQIKWHAPCTPLEKFLNGEASFRAPMTFA